MKKSKKQKLKNGDKFQAKLSKNLDALEWYEGSLRARFGMENESQSKVLQIASNLMIASAMNEANTLQERGLKVAEKLKNQLLNKSFI